MARAAQLPVGEVRTNAEIRSGNEELVALIVVLLLIVAAAMALVAAVGVAGTMTLSVVEQTREIGVLRTLGASGSALRRLLLLQGLVIATAGSVLGVVLSLPVSVLLRAAVAEGLVDAAVPTGFSWVGVAVWVPVALGIGALGATRPARAAARLTVRETLAYE